MSNRLASKQKKKRVKLEEILHSLIEYMIAIIGIAVSIMVPLYLQDGYHSVGVVKYNLYQWIVVIGFIVTIILTIFYWVNVEGDASDLYCKTDYFFAAFLILSFVSAFVGGNFKDCLAGYNGWFMGLIALFSFALMYYFFTRFGRYYKAVVACLLATTFVAMMIGVLHRIMIDVIGTYGIGTFNEIADTYKNQFLSTLGQATWYSSFVMTVFPLGIGIFYASKKRVLRILSGIFSFIGFATMVTQNSDSAYFAFIGFMMVFFWFSATSSERMQRFLEICLLFVWATRFDQVLLWLHANPILKLDELSNFMVFSPYMWGVSVFVTIFYVGFYACVKKGIYHMQLWKVLRYIALGVLVVAFLFAAVTLVLSANQKLSGAWLALSQKVPYLSWSDNWGNGRGRTWAFSIKMFADMDIFHQLFGVGPDGYAPYAYSLYQERLAQMWGERTLANAHNEWLNALICYGVVGTIAYVGIFITAIKQFIKQEKEQPILVGYIACVVSYMCHNSFCYQQVCCTPFLFMLIAIGIYKARQNIMKNENV